MADTEYAIDPVLLEYSKQINQGLRAYVTSADTEADRNTCQDLLRFFCKKILERVKAVLADHPHADEKAAQLRGHCKTVFGLIIGSSFLTTSYDWYTGESLRSCNPRCRTKPGRGGEETAASSTIMSLLLVAPLLHNLDHPIEGKVAHTIIIDELKLIKGYLSLEVVVSAEESAFGSLLPVVLGENHLVWLALRAKAADHCGVLFLDAHLGGRDLAGQSGDDVVLNFEHELPLVTCSLFQDERLLREGLERFRGINFGGQGFTTIQDNGKLLHDHPPRIVLG